MNGIGAEQIRAFGQIRIAVIAGYNGAKPKLLSFSRLGDDFTSGQSSYPPEAEQHYIFGSNLALFFPDEGFQFVSDKIFRAVFIRGFFLQPLRA